ncbi:MAG TPA: hypothetical protein VGM93_13290, partial [Acidimicrobiales bacterium]
MKKRNAGRRVGAAGALALLGALMLLVGVVNLTTWGVDTIRQREPFDLDINMVAAQRLVHHQPLYDQEASRKAAVKIGGPGMARTYTVATDG